MHWSLSFQKTLFKNSLNRSAKECAAYILLDVIIRNTGLSMLPLEFYRYFFDLYFYLD